MYACFVDILVLVFLILTKAQSVYTVTCPSLSIPSTKLHVARQVLGDANQQVCLHSTSSDMLLMVSLATSNHGV